MGKLVVLMITALVDMVGLLAVIPLLPFYATKFGANGFVVGLLVSSFSIAQLVSAPMWGRVSDRYGRRPALLAGLSASAIAYVVFGFANSLWLLFLSRLVQGAGGGTVGVVQAYVADATRPEDRAKALGWLSAATNVGVTVGPVIGSWTHHWGDAAPGLFAAGLCLLNIAFAFKFLSESHTETAAATGAKVTRSREAVLRILTHSGEPASRLIWIYAIAMGAFQGMTAILALFLARRFGVTENNVGIFFAYVGAISVVTRAFILGWLVDRLGEARLSRIGLIVLAAGLATIPLCHSIPTLALAVALVPFGTAFTFPCVTGLLSQVIAKRERGLYMGVQQTYGGAARVLGPIWAGFAWDRLGVGVPFWTGAALVAGTLFLGVGMEHYTRTAPEVVPGD
ncbi:MAG TPA: MFS transporter [Longimicrobiales bacterium]|nr:MFS transporter [Longimicrobiales bacterium]